MLRRFPLQTRLLLLVCLVLLRGSVAGAHVHLCFDGRESPASFHLSDLGLQHAEPGDFVPGMDAAHEDLVIAVRDNLLSRDKFRFAWTPVLALLAAVVLPGLLRTSQHLPPRDETRASSPVPLYLRPPLRGPPRLISR